MRNLIYSLTGIFLLLGLSPQASAQKGFEEFDREQGIIIQYRWQKLDFFKSDSDAALVLRLTNETENYVEVTFNLGFYRNQQMILENQDNNICLRPGQSRRGSPAGLRFAAEGITLEMTEEEWFSWDISQMEVTIVESCD